MTNDLTRILSVSVILQYYDSTKEDEFQAHVSTIQSAHGSAKSVRQPPGLRFSEGSSYNIINHSILDENKLTAVSTMEQRVFNRIKKGKIEKSQRETGLQAFDLEQARKLNRLSYERIRHQQERGYGLLKNESAAVQKTHPPKPPSTFELMQRPNVTQFDGRASHLRIGDMRDGCSGSNVMAFKGSGEAIANSEVSIGFSTLSNSTLMTTTGELAPESMVYKDKYLKLSTQEARRVERDLAGGVVVAPLEGIMKGRASMFPSAREEAIAVQQVARAVDNAPVQSQNASRMSVVPKLDLSRTEQAPAVNYVEPTSGGDGTKVLLAVRTGGL